MANSVTVFISKLTRKLAMAVLISALALVAYSLWIFTRDRTDFEEHRSALIAQIAAHRTQANDALAATSQMIVETKAAIEVQRQRIGQAEKVLMTMKEIEPGTLERLFGDKDVPATYDARLARLLELKTQAQTKTVELQRILVQAEQRKDAESLRSSELGRDEAALRNETYAVEHYLRAAWIEARWMVFGLFLCYLFGGLAVAILLYYCWSAWMVRGASVQLASTETVAPDVRESAVVIEDSLWPGETLWVRRAFLHGNDDELKRRSRFLLSWSHPFSCLAGGLVRLVELRNGRSDGERRVVYSCADDPFAELTLVSVPDDGSYVVRMSLVAGYVTGIDQRPVIRRRWKFWHRQSWVSGRFGYFEFHGPCRLLISGVSAMTADKLQSKEEAKPQNRRFSQAGVVGFSPQLALKPVRSVGFWRYCRGQSPLFDLWVEGSGVILTRGTEGRGRDGLRARLLKRIGL